MRGHEEYRGYVGAKASSRAPIVMFGANDGMFHVLDARTGLASSGREIFAYVPRAAYAALGALSDPAYTHRYSVDGPVIEGDVWTGTSRKTIAIATTGAGAAGIFAIDVTAPGTSMGASSVLWDITPADHPSALVRNTLGLTIGAGVIVSVRFDADGTGATEPNGAWAYVVGNGYESRNGTAALLVFDALDGSLIRAIDTGVGAGGNPNGLGAVTPVYDGNRARARRGAVRSAGSRGGGWSRGKCLAAMLSHSPLPRSALNPDQNWLSGDKNTLPAPSAWSLAARALLARQSPAPYSILS